MNKNTYKNFDEYISFFPVSTQKILKKIRQVIKKEAPDAVESISYQMPAFKLNGPLVYFGAYEKHIGFYPTGLGIESFKKELSQYETSKGTVRFYLDKPIPYDLIKKMVAYRVKENLSKKKK